MAEAETEFVADDVTEFASDGTAIGAVGDLPGEGVEVECKPAVFDEETGMIARIESAMSPDAVLAGKDRTVSADAVEALLPKYNDRKLRLRAVKLYVEGKYSLHTIAETLEVPDRTVARWAEEGNWIEFNERMVNTLKKHEKVRVTMKRIREREKAIDEQVELGHKITEAGKQFIEGAESAGQFKAAVEGVKLGSDMVGRALAINESGKLDAEANKGDEGDGRTPLVAVIAGGGLPTIRVGNADAGEVIDVK